MQTTGSHMTRTYMRLSSGVLFAPENRSPDSGADGSFVGVMVIQSEKDLENFKRLYRVDDVRKIY